MSQNEQNTTPTTSNKAPVRLRKPVRSQVKMTIQCVDDLVSASHPVRVVEAFVATLDLSAFCEPIKAREGQAGQSSTDPALLVSLWLYACIRGIGSAREVDRRCGKEDSSAPFVWLCGDVTVNHHLLSDFRVDHGDALDELFTQVLALLVKKGLVKVRRISQDGVRVRASAGTDSFSREESLEKLLEESKKHVELLRKQLDDPAYSAGLSARQKAAKTRAAKDKQKRLEQAIAELPDLKKKRDEAAKKAGNGKRGKKIREKELRVSSTDPDARVMKMPNGGFNPAVNVQLATDTESRAIIGVEVSNEGSDSAGLSEPMRKQVEQRTGQKVQQHLLDGGYLKHEDIEEAHAQGVELFMPPKTARTPGTRGKELEPKPDDSQAILAWKKRMREEAGKQIYKERAATNETVNADLRTHRGLTQLNVRGIPKARCVAVWCALAYNVMHFAGILLS
jgi:transposase